MNLSTRKVALAWAILWIGLLFYYGGPTAFFYSFFDHEGSKAYERRSFSTMDEGDHHAKVCDHNLFYRERVVVGVRGENIVVILLAGGI